MCRSARARAAPKGGEVSHIGFGQQRIHGVEPGDGGDRVPEGRHLAPTRTRTWCRAVKRIARATGTNMRNRSCGGHWPGLVSGGQGVWLHANAAGPTNRAAARTVGLQECRTFPAALVDPTVVSTGHRARQVPSILQFLNLGGALSAGGGRHRAINRRQGHPLPTVNGVGQAHLVVVEVHYQRRSKLANPARRQNTLVFQQL